MKRIAERRREPRVWAVMVGLAVVISPEVGGAEVPPLEFGLKAVGSEAGERRKLEWRLEKVEEGGLKSFREKRGAERVVLFEGEGERLEVGPESEGVWRYVWATLWAEDPAEVVQRWPRGQSGQVEVVGGQLGYCYGEEARICLDEELRQVLLINVVEEGKSWEIRVSQAGRALQVSLDGGLYARFRGSEAR